MRTISLLMPDVLRPTRCAVRRALLAGSAWGVTMGAGLTALSAWDCGGVCLFDAALTTVLSTLAGILTIGPLAAFGRSVSPRA